MQGLDQNSNLYFFQINIDSLMFSARKSYFLLRIFQKIPVINRNSPVPGRDKGFDKDPFTIGKTVEQRISRIIQ